MTIDDFHAPDIDGWRFLKDYPNISIREPHTDNTGWWVSVKIDTPVFNMDNVKLSQTFSWKRSVKTHVEAMELVEAGVGLTKSLTVFSDLSRDDVNKLATTMKSSVESQIQTTKDAARLSMWKRWENHLLIGRYAKCRIKQIRSRHKSN